MTTPLTKTPPSQALLQLNEVAFSYGSRRVLDGLDVSVREGEIHGLLGPNGSGKSTALSLLTGMMPIQGGNFLFRGAPLKPHARDYLDDVGVVFQSPSIDLTLSCRENLQLASLLRGIPRREAAAKIEGALAQAELVDRADDPASQLSGGMRRRLDIGRALLHEPSLLLLDEPTTGLDEAAFRATWHGIEAARDQRNLTVVVATHRADEAERCDRISILAEGKNLVTDAPETLRKGLEADVIIIEASDPDDLCQEIKEKFAVSATRESESAIMVECAGGHELIARLVGEFPQGRLKTLSLRQPTLADVFVKATGKGLGTQRRPDNV